MSVIATAVKHLLAAGVTGDDLIAAIAEMEASMAPAVSTQRTARQERNRRYYEKNKASEKRLKASEPSYSDASAPSPSSFPLDPPSQTHPPIIPQPSSPAPGIARGAMASRQADLRQEFDSRFWPNYPNKVGKPVAFKAFVKARAGADLETIMAGLRAYVGKRDDRPWCNPATWLNQERWNDLPAMVQRGPPGAAPGPDGLHRDQQGRVSMADFTGKVLQRMKERDDGRTIEADYQHGAGDGIEPAFHRARAEERFTGIEDGQLHRRLPRPSLPLCEDGD
ncbi:hypothetical protein [Gellertiella hungarica]|uniref:Uncharacterized protein n=1 Tax=Gellertiella hungarica TaxID=1572859 RepID=A0A7W6NMM7_9HYPH|nr:hypothetical protein [Gellertiella hungarica]MBB4066774.1 hypothetical protein [Gellertiella hungarica]